MFHDLSFKKVLPMLFVAAAFVVAISSFVYINTSLQAVDRTLQFAERVQSGFLFSVLFNPPWGRGAAAVALGASGSATAIPVLLYHGTPPEGNSNPPLPQNVFVDQLRALKADGWQTITMQQFTDFMKNKISLPEKSFLLTFDDGRKESFYPVDPALQELGYNAVMFVITGFSLPDDQSKASTFYLSKTELSYMLTTGRWELESHGAEDHRLYDVPKEGSTSVETIKQEHFLSNKFWLADLGRIETTDEFTKRITADLTTSKQTLQNDFGKPVTAFAFPFNDYGQDSINFPQSRDILAQALPPLYTFGFYQIDSKRQDPFNYPDPSVSYIKRIEPTADWSGADLVSLLDGARVKDLPYTSTTFTNQWNSNWGKVVVQNGALALRAATTTSGAVALLNGTYEWQDYTTHATVNWQSGDAVSLIARYQSDSRTFLTCAFDANRITLQTHTDGKTSVLASEPYTLAAKNNLQISMSVHGKDVSCSAAGVTVEKSVDTTFAHSGSMGIQIWGKTLGTEALDVSHISADNN